MRCGNCRSDRCCGCSSKRGATGATGATGSTGAAGATGPGGEQSALTARVTNSVDQNVVGTTAIQYDTAEFDLTGFFSALQPTRLTAPVNGIYGVIGQISLTGGTPPSSALALLRKNGVDIIARTRGELAGTNVEINFSTTINLLAGEYIEMLVTPSGGVGVVSESDPPAAPELNMFLIREV